jgi:hypothetical protein
MLTEHQSSSGITSKIDSIFSAYPISSKERLDLILEMDENLRETFVIYKKNKSNYNFEHVVQAMNKISLEKDIKVSVRVLTKSPGAFVKYRTQALADSIQASNPTNSCLINVYIGNYYFWTVRGLKRTAIPQKHSILQAETITIDENSK